MPVKGALTVFRKARNSAFCLSVTGTWLVSLKNQVSLPHGTIAAIIRCGGAGIPAFYTKTGVGTLIAEGKEEKLFDGEKYIMERGLFADLAIVHAWKGDTSGNLVYRKTARNFNPMMATAAKITVARSSTCCPPARSIPIRSTPPASSSSASFRSEPH